MSDLPTTWAALCALACLLGLRHGLDADHLAAIDGLTRVAARDDRGRARRCGTRFSLGHGAVVIVVAGLVGHAGTRWAPPAWFEELGAAVSIACLAALGLVNLRAAWQAPAGSVVNVVGLRGRLASRLLGGRFARSRIAPTLIGALFALSFDTLSQSALFAAMAARHGGAGHALVLAGLFVGGMVLSDGLNGWWVARLIDRSDRRAAAASRVMTLAVAVVSLAVAALGTARWLSLRVEGLTEGRETWFGLAVVASVALAYAWARRLPSAPAH